ncbi:MAG TPA: 50S ribosomal protein L17 [Candidatus Saccharimonadales bacterium]|nr:50S ribosomal protein L17 [Candidatus Saccharimonadales bacterium]
MHRHGYKGKKFGRKKDQRRALLKGLADSLILEEKIETTITKAKEIVPYTEKLITKAKKGGLHRRRQIIADLNTLDSAHKLFDEVAPKLKTRTSGYLRITKTTLRRGDNTQMASVSFVDDLKAIATPVKPQEPKKQVSKPKTADKKAQPTKKKPTPKAKKTTKKADK